MGQNQNRYSASSQNRDQQRGMRDNEDRGVDSDVEPNDDHHGDAAFHHETAAHHHDEAARNRREGNHADADRHAQLANVHGQHAEDATERARRAGHMSGDTSSQTGWGSGRQRQGGQVDEPRGSRSRGDHNEYAAANRPRNDSGSSSRSDDQDVGRSGKQNGNRDDENRNHRS